ncbi:hypothetical protein UCRPC4_g04558 [Phaeomoniella chlamydospora]|uniref:Uncharacterized protein n=1 Tax=Phaeomoniella chlamydospora TaxID=158046 RepID=A0A0G2E9E8_PHACM|nr:hypothetical protein UCRPC4_g04558 [Phaeomoniella chlamydospora]
MNAYIEQSRALLETQRRNFEHERETFEAERTLWDAERKMLLAKIADLELRLNKQKGPKRRYSNETPASSSQSFRSDFSLSNNFTLPPRDSSTTAETPPVWETPDMGPAVTRVFSDENKHFKRIELKLPSISEYQSPPSLDGALSPNAKPIDPSQVPISIPIEKLDSRLDGITLKSTALPPFIVAKVITPNSSSPHTPSPQPKTPNGAANSEVGLSMLQVTDPPYLKTNAGHTPLAFDGPLDVSRDASDFSTPTQKVKDEKPLEAVPPTRPPNERADSYFPDVSPPKSEVVDPVGAEEPPATVGVDDGEVELKGPLMLESQPKDGEDNEFLKELDARLLMEAKKIVGPSKPEPEEGGQDSVSVSQAGGVDDDEPKLVLRKSSNFGSAFGASDCGKIR